LKRNKDEKQFPGEYGRGKTIDRIDYQSIIRECESDLHKELATMARKNQKVLNLLHQPMALNQFLSHHV